MVSEIKTFENLYLKTEKQNPFSVLQTELVWYFEQLIRDQLIFQ
jgi:hypothetical protein